MTYVVSLPTRQNLNTTERFYIHKEALSNNQLNDKHTIFPKMIHTHTHTHTTSHIQPEGRSKKPKHVAEICQFIKYLIKSFVGIYFITSFN